MSPCSSVARARALCWARWLDQGLIGSAHRFSHRHWRDTGASDVVPTVEQIELTGEHVRLRPLQTTDAETTLAWRLGDRAELLNRGAATVAEQTAWIEARPDTEYNFLIELRAGQPVGMLSLVNVDLVHRRAEPARFLIGKPDAVKGVPVAVEALKLLYELAFDRLGLHRLHGAVVAENRQMLKWHLYLGMKEEGRLREHQFIAGRFHDIVCVGMMEDEFRKIALPRMNALIRSTPPAERT